MNYEMSNEEKNQILLGDIDMQIEKYFDTIEILWNSVIMNYTKNFYSNVILNKLTECHKNKFYDLMCQTTTFKFLMESRKRLNELSEPSTR